MGLTNIIKKTITKRKVRKALRGGLIFNRKANEFGTEPEVFEYAGEIINSNIYGIDEQANVVYKLTPRQIVKFIKTVRSKFDVKSAGCVAKHVIKILDSYDPLIGWTTLKRHVNEVKDITSNIFEKNLVSDDIAESLKELAPKQIYANENLDDILEQYKSQLKQLDKIKKTKSNAKKNKNKKVSALSIANLLNKYCSKLNSNIAYSAKKIAEHNQISKNKCKLHYDHLETLIKTITKNYDLENSKSILADGIASILQAMPGEKIAECLFKELVSFFQRGFFSRFRRKKKFSEEYQLVANLFWTKKELY